MSNVDCKANEEPSKTRSSAMQTHSHTNSRTSKAPPSLLFPKQYGYPPFGPIPRPRISYSRTRQTYTLMSSIRFAHLDVDIMLYATCEAETAVSIIAFRLMLVSQSVQFLQQVLLLSRLCLHTPVASTPPLSSSGWWMCTDARWSPSPLTWGR